MLHDIIFLILGLVLLILGANYVTDGAVAIAHRFKVSNLIIGLTVVALGSSMPDIVVCVESALKDKTALAVGEVVGANIFDLLLAVGVMGLIRPWSVSDVMRRQDLPILFIASAALWVAGDTVLFDSLPHNVIDRSSGIMMLVIFFFYMWFMITSSRSQTVAPVLSEASSSPDSTGQKTAKTQESSEEIHQSAVSVPSRHSHTSGIAMANLLRADLSYLESKYSSLQKKLWFSAILVVGGLGALVIGGNWVVDGAGGLALKIGMSQGLVALTIVAIGNSLPDIVTSVTATLKNANGIAFGNIVGACIINALLALGLSATIKPLGADTIGFVDFITLVGASALIWIIPALQKSHKISRIFGIILILLYIAYMVFTVIRG